MTTNTLDRRAALRRFFVAGAAIVFSAGALLAGCGRGSASGRPASLAEAVDNTTQTLRDLLLGVPPERQGTAGTRPDPPLLSAGSYQEVVIAADADGFARESRGAISANAVRDLQVRVVRALDRDLKKRGFAATGAAFDTPGGVSPVPSRSRNALLATLTPLTEPAGSPAERASGRAKTILLIRLAITDPATDKTLVQRDYYSGRDIPASRERR